MIKGIQIDDLNMKDIKYKIDEINLSLPIFTSFGNVYQSKYSINYTIGDNFIDEIQSMINNDDNIKNRQLRQLINLAFENNEPLSIVLLRLFLSTKTDINKKQLANVLDPFFGDIKIVYLFINHIKDKITEQNAFPFSNIGFESGDLMKQITYQSIIKFSTNEEKLFVFDVKKPYLAQIVWYHITFNNPSKYPLFTLLIKGSLFFFDFKIVQTIINSIIHLRHLFSYNPVMIPIILNCTSLFQESECKVQMYSLSYFDKNFKGIQNEIDKLANFLSSNYKESYENSLHHSSYYQIKLILKIFVLKYNEIVDHLIEFMNIKKEEIEDLQISSILPGMLLTDLSLKEILLPIVYEEKIRNFDDIEMHIKNCFKPLKNNENRYIFPLFRVEPENSTKDFVGFSPEDYVNMFRNYNKFEIEETMYKPLNKISLLDFHQSVFSFFLRLYQNPNKNRYYSKSKYKKKASDKYECYLNTYSFNDEYSNGEKIIFYERYINYQLQDIFALLPIELKWCIKKYQGKYKGLKIISSDEVIDMDAEIDDIFDYTKNGSLNDVINSFGKNETIKGFTNTSRQIILLGVCRSLIQLNKDKKYLFEIEPRIIFLDEKFYPHLNTFYTSSHINNYKAPKDNAKLFESKIELMKSDVFSFGLIMYELLASVNLFSDEKISPSQVIKDIMSGNYLEFPESISEPFKKLIKSCLSADQNVRPTFVDIFYLLANDSNYCLDDVDLNEYKEYIKSIANDLVFCTTCCKLIEEDELFYFS